MYHISDNRDAWYTFPWVTSVADLSLSKKWKSDLDSNASVSSASSESWSTPYSVTDTPYIVDNKWNNEYRLSSYTTDR